jgi:hypothetical protein
MIMWPFKKQQPAPTPPEDDSDPADVLWVDGTEYGGWETHPCLMPEFDLEDVLSRLNQTWQCWCGRRWKLYAATKEYKASEGGWVRVNEWEEVMPSTPLTDAEMMRLLEDTDGIA